MAAEKITSYNAPSLDQWMKDSSVSLAPRKEDISLPRIDIRMDAL